MVDRKVLRITLDNDKTYLESNLIKTDLETKELNIINKTIKESSIRRTLKKEGIDSNKIITHAFHLNYRTVCKVGNKGKVWDYLEKGEGYDMLWLE